MKFLIIALPLLLSTAAAAQPSIEIGPGGVRVGPRVEPREERVVREEGPCRVTIVRRFDEYGRRTTRRIRECDDDDED